MVATMIYLVISLLVSLIFIILGIRRYRAEKPVAINTGEKPPREDELTSVTEWNHRHGRNFIILGCALFITLSIVAYFIEKLYVQVAYLLASDETVQREFGAYNNIRDFLLAEEW